MSVYETVWTGALETAAVKARQRVVEASAPRVCTTGQNARQAVLTFLRAHPNASMLAITEGIRLPRTTVEDAVKELRRRGRIDATDNTNSHKRKLYRVRLSSVQYARSNGVEDS